MRREFHGRRPAGEGSLDESDGNAYNAIIDCTVGSAMASITIRNLDDRTKSRLRLRAARHARSMEEEARTILREALSVDAPAVPDLADAIRARFRAVGGVDLEIAPREPIRKPPKPAK